MTRNAFRNQDILKIIKNILDEIEYDNDVCGKFNWWKNIFDDNLNETRKMVMSAAHYLDFD